MEAVAVGANVVAFIALGLKSAKIIHETLSAIRDGPQIVSKAADDVLQFSWVLERLQRSQAAAKDPSLCGHTKKCVEDLDTIAKSIQKLRPRLGEKGTATLWKRLNVYMSEKELVRMSEMMLNHVSILNLRLSVLLSDFAYVTQDTLHRLGESTETINETVNQQRNVQDASFSILQEQNHTLQDVSENMTSLRSDFRSIRDAVSAVPSVSSTQADTMLQMLKELQGQVAALSVQHAASGSESTPNNSVSKKILESETLDEAYDQGRNEDAEMVRSIERLCALVNRKQQTIDVYDDELDGSNQAENIIQDLGAIIKSARTQINTKQRSKHHTFTSVAGGIKQEKRDQVLKDLTRFSRTFSSATRISINQPGRQSGYPAGTALQQERRIHRLCSGIGTVSVMSVHRRKILDKSAAETQNEQDEYLATITFHPSQPRRFHALSIHIDQRQVFGVTRLQIPRLEVNRILPRGSPVFDLVERGQVQELQELIRAGKASLQDQDEVGQSLLFYATGQPEMCRFLIDNGANLNHIADTAVGYSPRDDLRSSVVDAHMAVRDRYLGRHDAIDQCLRMLLEEGADPTIDTFPLVRASSSLKWVMFCKQETIQAIWTPQNVFLDSDINLTLDWAGRTALLQLAARMGVYTREIFSHLLARGADINARDKAGQNCLHLCLRNLEEPKPGIRSERVREEQEALIYLVQRGADIFAKTNTGNNVSNVAKRACCFNYAADLWDSVLVVCGHQIPFSFYSQTRKAILYGQQNFELLWKGREHLCPYWDSTTSTSWLQVDSGDDQIGVDGI